MVLPRTPAPPLQVPVVSGGSWRLADQHPSSFTLLVFYRGLHCPACHDQLEQLAGKLDALAEVGVDSVLAVSGDTRERAERTAREWAVPGLTIGYDLSQEQMRQWGLFLSRGIKEPEPELFNEPALFLIDPQGVVYSAHVQSTPFARPHLDNLVHAVGFIREHDYPARGEA